MIPGLERKTGLHAEELLEISCLRSLQGVPSHTATASVELTVTPRFPLTLAALRVFAPIAWAYPTAIWTDHLATSTAICALDESRNLLTIRKDLGYLLNLCPSICLAFRIVFVYFQSADTSIISTTSPATCCAAALGAYFTSKIAMLPATSCDWVAGKGVCR